MTKRYALSSPKNTNIERLYSDAAWLAPRGPAYDAVGGLEQSEPSHAAKVARMITDCLSRDELADLGREVVKARDAKYGAAQDEEPSLDPNASRSNVPAQAARLRAGASAVDSRRRKQVAMDSKFASVLKAAFRPGTQARALEGKHAMDTAIALEMRLGIKLPEIDTFGDRDNARTGTSNRKSSEASLFER
jgi:hypothetical protein